MNLGGYGSAFASTQTFQENNSFALFHAGTRVHIFFLWQGQAGIGFLCRFGPVAAFFALPICGAHIELPDRCLGYFVDPVFSSGRPVAAKVSVHQEQSRSPRCGFARSRFLHRRFSVGGFVFGLAVQVTQILARSSPVSHSDYSGLRPHIPSAPHVHAQLIGSGYDGYHNLFVLYIPLFAVWESRPFQRSSHCEEHDLVRHGLGCLVRPIDLCPFLDSP